MTTEPESCQCPAPIDMYYVVKVVASEGDDLAAKNKENLAFIRRVMKKRFGVNTQLYDLGVRLKEADTLSLVVGPHRDDH